ncbi:MAG: DNA polymerase III subunit gamma/tau [Candidatus Kerfeldbacteria bacterium]|nr:DNA polymerase III subunit gamma/tau [Candidatus Kerfeldbacteria bacterium]
MPPTLYRKYRPQTFAELVNQQHIRITLQQALVQGRVAHAYLFAGPRGIGKTTVARLLARAVNCQRRQPDGEPCNRCPTCQAMLSGSALDIIEIDAASQTGVDNVRENILHNARVGPTLGQFKVFIIDEVHMLSLAAFNALLKMLEEPPAHALFILATTEVHRVPATIISRSQRFDFKRLGVQDMAERLNRLAQQEKRQLADGVAERIARFAHGSMRDAESMLGQLFSFQEAVINREVADLVLPRSNEEVVAEIMAAVVHGQAAAAMVAFHRYCDEGGDIPVLAHELVLAGRTLMLASVDPTLLDQVLDDQQPAHVQELRSLVRLGSTERFIDLVEALTTAERQLQRSTFLELPVEVALIRGATFGQPADTDRASPETKTSPARPTPPEPPAGQPKRANVTKPLPLAMVQQAWQTVQKKLNGSQPSLRLSLQQATIKESKPGLVVLEVPFALHRQRLTDPKHRQVLEQALSKVLKTPFTIEVVTSNGAPPRAVQPGPAKKGDPESGSDLWEKIVASFS